MSLLMDWLRFERSHFAQPADVAFFLGKLGGQECIDKFSGDNKSHHPAADTEDVHIVVLDPLVSRVVVLNQPGADPRNLARTDRRADSAAADSQAAFHLSGSNRLSERDDEVGIIVARIETVRPEIDHLMPLLAKVSHQLFLQAKSTVIGCNSYAHVMLPFCFSRSSVPPPLGRPAQELVHDESGPPESPRHH